MIILLIGIFAIGLVLAFGGGYAAYQAMKL